MDEEQDDESIAIQHLRRHSSHIPLNVYRIHVSNTGEIVSIYTDVENDETCCVHYPLLDEISLPEGVRAVRRDMLEELERLGPDTDLVTYPPCSSEPANKVVFKYCFLWQYAQKSWKEMNIRMRLPRHPNIVPFDRIVLDELEGRVVGFTNCYVPCGTLEENRSRVFRLKWLQQLIQVVDDLNLRYSISHQDVAPRNIVVDEPTDSIMLLDFNFAARIDHPSAEDGEGEWHDVNRNDVKGVIFTIYEIITRDDSLRDAPHEEQNIESLPLEWVKHQEVQLDRPVVEYRQALQEWRGRRALDPKSGDIPKAINWQVKFKDTF
ncbi:EKC/KEOPS complex subunit BUD32 [Fusarium sp. Ph1]|nr:EKC/KEOPS complex subunit BUD32 [Fusarium sp. Ph1]